MPDLIQAALAHPNEDVGWFAAQALGNLGPAAHDALPALKTAMGRSEWGRDLVEEAIRRITLRSPDGGDVQRLGD
jgi:hypothetical protein